MSSLEWVNNDENFRVSLRLHLQDGDATIKWHLQRGPEWDFFIILCNGTPDVVVKQQMVIVLRFAQNVFIHKIFLDLEELQQMLQKYWNRYRIMVLIFKQWKGKWYDDCRSLIKHTSGFQAYVMRLYSTAVNLVIVKATYISGIVNGVNTAKYVINFIRSCAKRVQVLQQSVDASIAESETESFRRSCTTRWVDRHNSVMKFSEMFLPVLETIEVISDWSDEPIASKTPQFQLQFFRQDSWFLSALVPDFHRFSFLYGTSCNAQIQSLVQCADNIGSVRVVCNGCKKNAIDDFENMFTRKIKRFGNFVVIPRKAMQLGFTREMFTTTLHTLYQ